MVAWILAFSLGCVPQAQYTKLENQYERAQREIERLKKDLATQSAFAEAMAAELRDLVTDLKPLIDAGVVEVEVVDGKIVIGMNADVLFASGSAELSPRGAQTVTDLARILARRAADHNFQVEGHTDSEPISTAQFPDNWYLGSARAIVVAKAMIAAGFPVSRLSAATYAQYQPIASNGTSEGRRQNRRIEVVLVPDLGQLPGLSTLAEKAPTRTRQRGKNQ
jgi:chemotaxis protein MotB